MTSMEHKKASGGNLWIPQKRNPANNIPFQSHLAAQPHHKNLVLPILLMICAGFIFLFFLLQKNNFDVETVGNVTSATYYIFPVFMTVILIAIVGIATAMSAAMFHAQFTPASQINFWFKTPFSIDKFFSIFTGILFASLLSLVCLNSPVIPPVYTTLVTIDDIEYQTKINLTNSLENKRAEMINTQTGEVSYLYVNLLPEKLTTSERTLSANLTTSPGVEQEQPSSDTSTELNADIAEGIRTITADTGEKIQLNPDGTYEILEQ